MKLRVRNWTLALLAGVVLATGGVQVGQAWSTSQANAIAERLAHGDAAAHVPLFERYIGSVEIAARVQRVGVGAFVVVVQNYDDPETPIEERVVPSSGKVVVNGEAFELRPLATGGLLAVVPAGIVGWPTFPGGEADDFALEVLDAAGALACAWEVEGASAL